MKNPNIIKSIEKYIRETCPGILKHTQGVASFLAQLTKRHGLDSKRALIAAWGHDIFRCHSENEIKNEIEKKQVELETFPASHEDWILFHGPLAAIHFPSLFNYKDPQVLKAMWNHTILSPKPTAFEASLYIADKLEPGKELSGDKKLIKSALNNISEGLYNLVLSTTDYLQKNDKRPHQNQIDFLKNYESGYRVSSRPL